MKILQEKLRGCLPPPRFCRDEKCKRISDMIDELPHLSGDSFNMAVGFLQGMLFATYNIPAHSVFLQVRAYLARKAERDRRSQWRVVWQSAQGPVRLQSHNTKAAALVELAEWRARCSPDLKFSLVRITLKAAPARVVKVEKGS